MRKFEISEFRKLSPHPHPQLPRRGFLGRRFHRCQLLSALPSIGFTATKCERGNPTADKTRLRRDAPCLNSVNYRRGSKFGKFKIPKIYRLRPTTPGGCVETWPCWPPLKRDANYSLYCPECDRGNPTDGKTRLG